MPTLTLIRGLPGSGKSTLASALRDFAYRDWDKIKWFEADMYFMDGNEYVFNASKLNDAHNWCQEETNLALQDDCDVVVSNTFTQQWEMQPYIDMAKELGAKLQIITVKADFGNVHNVPEDVLKKMAERWED